MKHIGTKLFLGFIGMAILTIGILWIVQAGFMRNTYLNERINSVEQSISKAAKNGATDYDGLAEQLNASLIVFDKNSSLTYRSQGLPMVGMMVRTIQDLIPSDVDGKARYVSSMSGSTRYAFLGNKTSDGGYLFAVFFFG